MAIESDDPATGELPRVSLDDTGGPPRPRRFRPFRFTLKLLAFVTIVYFAAVTIVPGVREAASKLRSVNPALLVLGLVLELAALFAYTLLTGRRSATRAQKISRVRLFRIQMSTKALSSIVPGGSAAGSALGYRLMTLSGVNGPDAGFALATAGLGSAVVLNLIFWLALMVSIPIRGVNPGYATAAIAGIVLMLVAGGIVFGLMEGQGRAEKMLRWVARKLRLNEDRTAAGRAPHRHAARGPRRRPRAAGPGARLGGGQLDARRRGAVGVPPRLRHVARLRRADRRLRSRQRPGRHPDHAGRARRSSTSACRVPWSASACRGRPRCSASPRTGSPSSSSRSCSAASSTAACASGPWSIERRDRLRPACATSPPRPIERRACARLLRAVLASDSKAARWIRPSEFEPTVTIGADDQS